MNNLLLNYDFHDWSIISLEQINSDVEMVLKSYGSYSNKNRNYIKLVFRNVENLVYDKRIRFGKNVCFYLEESLSEISEKIIIRISIYSTDKKIGNSEINLQCKEIKVYERE